MTVILSQLRVAKVVWEVEVGEIIVYHEIDIRELIVMYVKPR